MHHHYGVLLAILANIKNIEALRKVKVDLDCRSLPGPP
jgi:hypothetical protein